MNTTFPILVQIGMVLREVEQSNITTLAEEHISQICGLANCNTKSRKKYIKDLKSNLQFAVKFAKVRSSVGVGFIILATYILLFLRLQLVCKYPVVILIKASIAQIRESRSSRERAQFNLDGYIKVRSIYC